MPLTDYVTLGRSGLRVSPLCLGTMTFGEDWGWGTPIGQSYDILSAYLERGGNFLDTANIYTKGHSEKIIGDYFADGPGKGRRDRVVIATKFGGALHRADPNSGGGHRKGIYAAVHESLRRLRTDYVDLLWYHFQDRHTPIDETMRTMDDLVKQGKVRYLGFSDAPAWVCVKAQYEAIFRGWTPLVALQIEYSLLQRTPEADLIPMAIDMGMGVTPWSPLRAGVLSGKFTRANRPPASQTRVREDSPHLNDHSYAVIDALIAIAGEVGCSPAQVALSWVQTRPGVTSTILGARRMAQLDDNLGAVDVTLSENQRARLDELTAFEPPFPHAFLEGVTTVIQSGATVNGVSSEAWELSPATDAERH